MTHHSTAQAADTQVLSFESEGFYLDFTASDVAHPPDAALAQKATEAFAAMDALEKGSIANPDEKRMVGHYWLRTPSLAPTQALSDVITQTLDEIAQFAKAIHSGKVRAPSGDRFEKLLLVGIGGSALGPQFVAHALTRGPADQMSPYFFDNTDPQGFDKVFASIGASNLKRTLTVVVSKSGGTKETRNGMLAAKRAYEQAGVEFAPHAVAVTQEGSELDRYAVEQRWMRRFPMWDWVGGRTSELSAVGLLPAALQGFDIFSMLKGASDMDALTRVHSIDHNPAMRLALAWYALTDGRGTRSMVVLPYRDRIELLSRYLQQLVMESLGKERDLSNNVVHQGISVYGNKGSTDQHAYVQQLRDGVANFFVTFVEALEDGQTALNAVESDQITAGDYLFGFLEGTRRALYENGRKSLTITVRRVDAHAIGMLIALFERAVGLYATLIHVNAYHQPGVEAGKKAAGEVIALQKSVVAYLRNARQSDGDKAHSAAEIAEALSLDRGTVWRLLRRLSANAERAIVCVHADGPRSTYRA
jgi:glucose-6-phosphate isomerase